MNENELVPRSAGSIAASTSLALAVLVLASALVVGDLLGGLNLRSSHTQAETWAGYLACSTRTLGLLVLAWWLGRRFPPRVHALAVVACIALVVLSLCLVFVFGEFVAAGGMLAAAVIGFYYGTAGVRTDDRFFWGAFSVASAALTALLAWAVVFVE